MFEKLTSFRQRFLNYKNDERVYRTLDTLLFSLAEHKTLEDQLFWLVKLLRWIRHGNETGAEAVTRLRFFILVLERQPELKKAVAKTLRNIIKQVSGFELYTETGLPKELGLWGELADRLMMKVLPTPPLDQDLSHLFSVLFPDSLDSVWIGLINRDLFDSLIELFNFGIEADENGWNRLETDIKDALSYLIIQARAIGLSPAIRNRLDNPRFSSSAFFHLDRGWNELIAKTGDCESSLDQAKISAFRALLKDCHRELEQVHKHLDQHGVSISLVFQMMRLRIFLQRIESLLDILFNPQLEHQRITGFLANLISENQELRSISTLLSQNIALFAKKIVERAAETGEHYITRTRAEYGQMLKAAAGGGAITAITVYLKMAIIKLGHSGFIEGFLVSLLYSLTFVVIQLLGFTLGTKQPAMTAPALADKMQDVHSSAGMQNLVTEIMYLIRSQVASVVGNVLLVFPCAFLINWSFWQLFDTPLLSEQTAEYAVQGSDVFGPSFFYAGITGVLLWLSSIISGWSDNWFALNSLRKTIARSPSMSALFGKRGARSLAIFLQNNISGLAGNISLGFFLGMLPVTMKFMSLPIDIRHVTISAGSFGAAIPSLGLDFLNAPLFWRALFGIALIGIINVLVSFGLALLVAIKARNIKAPQRSAIRQAIRKQFFTQPLGFFFPLAPKAGLIAQVAKGPNDQAT